MRETAAHERFIIEGAAGVAVAAALETGSDYRGRSIAIAVCGRNIAMNTFRKVMGVGNA